jgi:hypothetical protein
MRMRSCAYTALPGTLAVSSKINEKIIDEVCMMMTIFVGANWSL